MKYQSPDSDPSLLGSETMSFTTLPSPLPHWGQDIDLSPVDSSYDWKDLKMCGWNDRLQSITQPHPGVWEELITDIFATVWNHLTERDSGLSWTSIHSLYTFCSYIQGHNLDLGQAGFLILHPVLGRFFHSLTGRARELQSPPCGSGSLTGEIEWAEQANFTLLKSFLIPGQWAYGIWWRLWILSQNDILMCIK